MHKLPTRRSIRILVFFLLLMPLGCGRPATEIPTATASVAPPTVAPTSSPTFTAAPSPTPTLTPFVPKATIKIVVHVPLSGVHLASGMAIRQGALLGVKQSEAPLNQLGYDVELVSYDDEGNVDKALANAREIVADPEVLCGVGHFLSIVTINASDRYHLAGLAFISPSSTAPKVTDRGYPEVNRVVGRDDNQGAAAAEFAAQHGFHRLFVINTGDNYTVRNANGFKRRAGELKMELVGDFTASVRRGNFQAVADRLLASGADAVNFSGPNNEAGAFIKIARAAGYQGAFIAMDATSDLVSASGPAALEGGGTFYTAQVVPAAVYPAAADFMRDYKLANARPAPLYAAQAYDAAGVCVKAILAAVNSRAGELPTRQEVTAAVRALPLYEGITGTFSFDDKGDQVPMRYFVIQVISADPSVWDQNPVVASIEARPE